MGVQAIEWLTPTAHLLLSADMSGGVKLWDVLDHKQQVGVFRSHAKAITSLTTTRKGDRFSTASYDGTIRVWDVEVAAVSETLHCPGDQEAYCRVHKFHPRDENSHLILSGIERKVLLWDLRSGNVVREYDRHLSSIMSLTFFDSTGAKFISTAEDKTIRTWDFNVPVQIQVFADAALHAVPHIVAHPTDHSFIAQSLNNEAFILQLSQRNNSLKFNKDRKFVGHLVSGTSCSVAVSRDGQFVSSGDVNGQLHIWSYGTGEKVKSFRAHGKQLVQHLWHPHDPTLVATSSWDGNIKLWS